MRTPAKQRSGLRIGQLAAQAGLNPRTIRYYERLGLLPPPPRTSSGYRLYQPAQLERLRFIRKAQAIGLRLEEIGQVLRLRDGGESPCGHVLRLIDQKLAAVERQLRIMEAFRDDLIVLRQDAAERSSAAACVCGIIEHHQLMG